MPNLLRFYRLGQPKRKCVSYASVFYSKITISCSSSPEKQSIQQLMQFKGIGEAKAITIVAALELAKRLQLSETKELTKIGSSEDVFKLMQPGIGDLPHEEFWVLLLNNSNKVIYKLQLSKGGLTQTVVDIRMLFKTALETFGNRINFGTQSSVGTISCKWCR